MARFLTSYFAIAGVLLLSGFGLPIPEDIPLLTAGVLCAQEHADLKTMIVLTFLAVLGADCIVYFMGRNYGHHIPRLPILRNYLTEDRLARAEAAFHRRGGMTLFTGRFLPGLRTPIFFTAGVFKIPFWKFLVFDGSAALLSVPVLVLLGYWGADKIEQIQEWTHEAKLILAAVILPVIAIVVFIKLRRRRKARVQPPTQSCG